MDLVGRCICLLAFTGGVRNCGAQLQVAEPSQSPWLPEATFVGPAPPWARSVWNISAVETPRVRVAAATSSINSTIWSPGIPYWNMPVRRRRYLDAIGDRWISESWADEDERRLTVATTLGTTVGNMSLRWASNVAAARLTSDKVALACSDYGYFFRGRFTTCQVQSASLTCATPSFLTTLPVHTDPQSLAIDAVYSNLLIVAWKQGSSPFIGHVQVCNSDTGTCGPDHQVQVEWGCVSVVALSQSVVAFAYSDVQVGHRGSLVKCDVANSNLNCDLAQVFEDSPIVSVALTALTADTLAYTAQTTDLLIAYQVSSLTQQFADVQPCVLASSRIVCYASSSARFNSALTSGISLAALSSAAFIVGYSDLSLYCPSTNRQSRRRAADVCTKADGHPSIGRMRLCRATFRGLGITDPVLECGQSAIVDDGYGTGAPYLMRRDGTVAASSPWHFLATYACNGCNDQGQQGLARSCTAPAMTAAGVTPPTPTCSSRLILNDNTTQWLQIAAISGGFLVAFDDYGSMRYLSARLVT